VRETGREGSRVEGPKGLALVRVDRIVRAKKKGNEMWGKRLDSKG